jgi:hypothetical protein
MALTRSLLTAALIVGVVAAALADQPPRSKSADPAGVYVYKDKDGVWVVTFEAGGTGRSESWFIEDGKVHTRSREFRWFMKGGEIVEVWMGDDPMAWLVVHRERLPDGKIRRLRTYLDGKLLDRASKDEPALEYLGPEAKPRPRPAAKPAELAKAAAQEYLKALRAKDLDRLLQATDAPWLEDGKRVVTDPRDVAQLMKEKLEGLSDPSDLPSEVLEVQRYGDVRDSKTYRHLRDVPGQFLDADDWVVSNGRNKQVYGSLFVRVSGGKARVVGYYK